MAKSITEMSGDIIAALAATGQINGADIPKVLSEVAATLRTIEKQIVDGPASVAEEKPSIAPSESIQRTFIVCLECGQQFKMLSPKHLRSHGLSPRQYRQKHGLSLRQPLCAKNLSAARKKAGKARGIPENLRKAINAKRDSSASPPSPAAGKKPPATKPPATKASAKKAPPKTPSTTPPTAGQDGGQPAGGQ